MTAGITVSSLFVYPVKALRGIPRDSVTVGRYGFEGDREWQIVGADGSYLTQRQLPLMARIDAMPVTGGLVLSSATDGSVEVERPTVADVAAKVSYADVRAGDAGDEAAAWLERVIGRPCRLLAIADGYTRPLLLEVEPPDIEVSFADAAPVLLTNTASLDDLVARATEPFAMDRFRPNLVVTAPAPWVEDGWHRARIGTVNIHSLIPWPRCAVPQVDQRTGERHKEPAKALRAHRWCIDGSALGPIGPLVENQPLFGVGVVAEPIGATITVGDPVEVVEQRPPLIAPPDPLAV